MAAGGSAAAAPSPSTRVAEAGGGSGATPPPCGIEALALLNCVAANPFDESRCVQLLSLLRTCIVRKNVKSFSIDGDNQEANNSLKDLDIFDVNREYSQAN